MMQWLLETCRDLGHIHPITLVGFAFACVMLVIHYNRRQKDWLVLGMAALAYAAVPLVMMH